MNSVCRSDDHELILTSDETSVLAKPAGCVPARLCPISVFLFASVKKPPRELCGEEFSNKDLPQRKNGGMGRDRGG